MPFQPTNYANIAPQGSPWLENFVENLTKGYQAGRLPFETEQAERGTDLTNQGKQYANVFQALLNREQPQKFSSDMATAAANRGYTEANTNNVNTMTPLDAEKQRLANLWYDKITQSQINSNNAMANWRNSGGSSAGVGQKEEAFFERLVAKDNPNLSPDQVYEASNVLRSGGNTLQDGTAINPLSPASMESFNRLTKGGTYAGAAVPIIKARQADAELKTLGSMSQADFAPFATTYAGYSPEQIAATFKSDNASQDKLGRFIASQAAQYEMAQIRNRIAGGEAGISATEELMGKSGQIINARYPTLSARARQTASKRLDEYLSAALKSRQAVGLGAASAVPSAPPVGGKSSGNATLRFNPSTGKLEPM